MPVSYSLSIDVKGNTLMVRMKERKKVSVISSFKTNDVIFRAIPGRMKSVKIL